MVGACMYFSEDLAKKKREEREKTNASKDDDEGSYNHVAQE
jgi:hypothetical protein